MITVQLWFVSLFTVLGTRVRARLGAGPRDRGDVPGWVMITVMTAALVLAILIPFRTAIVDAVNNALDSVITGAS